MHDTSGEHIFIPPVFSKVFTSKVTQLIVNPRCDIAGFTYEVFHDRIDQGIDSIGNSFAYAFVKDRLTGQQSGTKPDLLLGLLDNFLTQNLA